MTLSKVWALVLVVGVAVSYFVPIAIFGLLGFLSYELLRARITETRAAGGHRLPVGLVLVQCGAAVAVVALILITRNRTVEVTAVFALVAVNLALACSDRFWRAIAGREPGQKHLTQA